MQRRSDEAETCRVVLIGDSYVGKTCLVTRLVKQEFNKNTEDTIGAAFETYEATLADGNKLKMQIWDTAGQEKYISLGPVYYRNASAGIFVYDVTESRTLDSLRVWVQKFRDTVGMDVPVFVVGNKADLDERRKVDCKDGQGFADSVGAKLFVEASALTGTNVVHLFQRVADVIGEQKKADSSGRSGKTTKKVELNGEQEKKPCC